MDSPKHIQCLNEGKTGQYYRIAGTNNYKCKSCGTITNGREFDPIEFSWKNDTERWKTWVNDKIKNDNGKKKLKHIVEVEVGKK